MLNEKLAGEKLGEVKVGRWVGGWVGMYIPIPPLSYIHPFTHPPTPFYIGRGRCFSSFCGGMGEEKPSQSHPPTHPPTYSFLHRERKMLLFFLRRNG